MNENITKLRTDAEKAQEYREELVKALGTVCDIFNRARSDGIIMSFNINADQFGRSRVAEIGAVKPL